MTPAQSSLQADGASALQGADRSYDRVVQRRCQRYDKGECKLGADCPDLHRLRLSAVPFKPAVKGKGPGETTATKDNPPNSTNAHEPQGEIPKTPKAAKRTVKNPCFEWDLHGACYKNPCPYRHDPKVPTEIKPAEPPKSEEEQERLRQAAAAEVKRKLEGVINSRKLREASRRQASSQASCQTGAAEVKVTLEGVIQSRRWREAGCQGEIPYDKSLDWLAVEKIIASARAEIEFEARRVKEEVLNQGLVTIEQSRRAELERSRLNEVEVVRRNQLLARQREEEHLERLREKARLEDVARREAEIERQQREAREKKRLELKAECQRKAEAQRRQQMLEELEKKKKDEDLLRQQMKERRREEQLEKKAARQRKAEERQQMLEELAKKKLEELIRQQREERERERRQREEVGRRRAEEKEKLRIEKLKWESEATVQLVVRQSNLVTFSAGVEIKGVIPGFDLCSITLRDLAPNVTREDVDKLFAEDLQLCRSTFSISSLKSVKGNTKVAAILMRSDEASVMELALDGAEIRGHKFKVEVGANATWGKMNSSSKSDSTTSTLTIDWLPPCLTMIGTLQSVEEAEAKAKEIDGRDMAGRQLRAAMNKRPVGQYVERYYNQASIRLTNIPTDLSVSDVAEATGIDSSGLRQIKSPIYDLDSVTKSLEQNLQPFNPVLNSFVTSNNGNRVQARIQFDSYDDANRACKAIEQGSLGTFPAFRPSLPKPHQYIITIPVGQYNSQKHRWDALGETLDKESAYIQVVKLGGGERVLVKVLGSNNEQVGVLKARAESLVAGDRLDSSHWNSTFLTSNGSTFLDKVNRDSQAYVCADRRLQLLRIFGNGEAISKARDMIKEEVDRLNGLEWSERIPHHAIAFFKRVGLEILEESEAVGKGNVSLDLASKTLRVKGGDDARQLVWGLQRQAAETKQEIKRGSGVGGAEETTCPICYGRATTETFICGHAYCHGCLESYLSSALDSDSFPLVCMGDECRCNAPLSIPLIQRHVSLEKLNRLAEVAFDAYLSKHQKELKFCQTPDCTQIYESTDAPSTQKCPSCFRLICGSCNEAPHEDMTCEEARKSKELTDEKLNALNDEWAKNNGVKRCPSCTVLVFKVDGCNHMHCKCGAHFCWVCATAFDDVYGHLSSAHGGYN
ncbi:hypothetical protein FA15DRAFT_673627 [Coprinopsis marcescibilis]|uniref:Uncharacterized protein n=1 Tax=Coprinopsis marcescibilis TaxID=230819 RepID=A0A5C3KK50_COPMA|nr:hypothetical protein FA15DRAFT_673627 [Coprinopsis marcescibilis]